MVDPNVLARGRYDPEEVTAFAFGLGVERLYGPDIASKIYATSSETMCVSSSSFKPRFRFNVITIEWAEPCWFAGNGWSICPLECRA